MIDKRLAKLHFNATYKPFEFAPIYRTIPNPRRKWWTPWRPKTVTVVDIETYNCRCVLQPLLGIEKEPCPTCLDGFKYVEHITCERCWREYSKSNLSTDYWIHIRMKAINK